MTRDIHADYIARIAGCMGLIRRCGKPGFVTGEAAGASAGVRRPGLWPPPSQADRLGAGIVPRLQRRSGTAIPPAPNAAADVAQW